MQLVIAEKPSDGIALAKALGVNGRKDGYVEGDKHAPHYSRKGWLSVRQKSSAFLPRIQSLSA